MTIMGADSEASSGWRDVALAQGPRAEAVARPSPWLAVAAVGLDAVALLLLGGVAALLRFGGVYVIRPQLQGDGGLCSDPAYKQSLREASLDVPIFAVYLLAIALPVVVIALLELALARSIQRSPRGRHSTIASLFVRRSAKMMVLFLLGLCITSVATDLIRILVSRPRPYFLSTEAFGKYCSMAEDLDMGPEEIEARLSFPSYRCTLTAFSSAVMVLYSERVLRRLGDLHVLRGILALAVCLPAMTVASQALDARTNHWEDVAAGLALGAILAAYVVLALARGRKLDDDGPESEAGGRVLSLPRPHPKPLGDDQLASLGRAHFLAGRANNVPAPSVLVEATNDGLQQGLRKQPPYLRLNSKLEDAYYY